MTDRITKGINSCCKRSLKYSIVIVLSVFILRILKVCFSTTFIEQLEHYNVPLIIYLIIVVSLIPAIIDNLTIIIAITFIRLIKEGKLSENSEAVKNLINVLENGYLPKEWIDFKVVMYYE